MGKMHIFNWTFDKITKLIQSVRTCIKNLSLSSHRSTLTISKRCLIIENKATRNTSATTSISRPWECVESFWISIKLEISMRIKKFNIFIYSPRVLIKRWKSEMHKRAIWKEQNFKVNVKRTKLSIGSKRVEFGWSDEAILRKQKEVSQNKNSQRQISLKLIFPFLIVFLFFIWIKIG